MVNTKRLVMETYKIEIKEFLSKIVEIEAKNVDEAISKVKEMYIKEEVILSENDFVTYEVDKYDE